MPPRRSLSPHWCRYEDEIPTVFDEPAEPLAEPQFFLDDADYEDTSDEDDHLSFLAEVHLRMHPEEPVPEYSPYDQNDPDTWSHQQHLDFMASVRALNAARIAENPNAALFSVYPGPSGEVMFQSQVHLVLGARTDLPEELRRYFQDNN